MRLQGHQCLQPGLLQAPQILGFSRRSEIFPVCWWLVACCSFPSVCAAVYCCGLMTRGTAPAIACLASPVEEMAARLLAMALSLSAGSRRGRCTRSPLPLARILHCLTPSPVAHLFTRVPVYAVASLSLLALPELPVVACLLCRCCVLILVPFLEFFFFQKNCALSQFFGHLCRRESPKGRNFKRVCALKRRNLEEGGIQRVMWTSEGDARFEGDSSFHYFQWTGQKGKK